MRTAGSLVLALLLSSLAPSLARADDQEIAKGHFSTGLSYYGSGEYASAAAEFLEAYRLVKSPDLLFNIALTYEKLDDPGHATVFYQRFLVARPDADERADVERKMARLAARVARLSVVSSAGSQIVVDGVAIGRAPVAPLVLSEGKHRVEALRDGFVSVAVEVDLVGGAAREIRVVPLDSAAPPRDDAPATPPTLVAAKVSAPAALPTPPAADWRQLADGPSASDSALPTDSAAPKMAGPSRGGNEIVRLYRPPETLETRARPARRIWPVVLGVVLGAVVVAGVALTLAFTLGGSDYSANARAACTGGCVLFDRNGFR